VKPEKVLGLIPARGGSKGIADKNIVDLAGRPLLGWVAEEAGKSEQMQDVIISSDSEKIIKTARDFGIRAPFVRPPELAQDSTLVIDVIRHALNWLWEYEQKKFDYVCLLQPTAPLAKKEDYDKAIALAYEKDADTIICVYKCDQHHPAIMFTLDDENRADWFVKKLGWNRMTRRQDLPYIYMRSGIVYVFKTDMLLHKNTLYGEKLYAVEVPIERGSVDINIPGDLKVAEVMINAIHKEQQD
jgi:CMP-N,N'-diacetyllegionaminic acid synthase